MCDCYEQKCEQCQQMIPVHIADFCTAKENLQVFCDQHLPEADCFIYTVMEAKRDKYDFKKGTKFGFRILDKTLFNYDDDMEYYRQQKYMVWNWATPNICQKIKLEVI